MNREISKSLQWGDHTLTLKTGLLATQADGAVMACMGDTHVLCTVVAKKDQTIDPGFMPLTVNYREMYSAAGKIPGGFLKKEGRQSDRESLISRLIDRPIRPLFGKSFRNETQIICTVMSYDPNCSPDIVALIGASAAIAISGIPVATIISAIRVGMQDGKFTINPSIIDLQTSDLDLVIAASKDSIMMVESGASNINDQDIIKALEFAYDNLKPVVTLIEDLQKEVGKAEWSVEKSDDSKVHKEIEEHFGKEIQKALHIKTKQERVEKLKLVRKSIMEHFAEREDVTEVAIIALFEAIKAQMLRKEILEESKRIDGRKLDAVRPVSCMTSVLPRAHGSSLFMRGETQALVVITLGSSGDEQIIDDITTNTKDRFMLQYSFPPYSVGEVSPLRGPGRREIGHGKLAHRALRSSMPDENESPYVIRIVSEITSCNGSSSMATICGASLALMDAGIPIKSHVAGIAMGLVMESKKYKILSDIMGDEDALGDMDFKVAGTRNGITALQMDIKVPGVTFAIMQESLAQARQGLEYIFDQMESSIASAKEEKSAYAPQIEMMKIHPDKIREVIGSGGKVIQEICEVSGAKIDIEKNGDVKIGAIGRESLLKAKNMIQTIVAEPELGKIYKGKVVKLIDSGAFVNYLGPRDGFLHISEISEEIVDDIKDHIDQGDEIKVKLLEVDSRGRSRLTMILDKECNTIRPKPSVNKSTKVNFRKPREGDDMRQKKKKRSGNYSVERKFFE